MSHTVRKAKIQGFSPLRSFQKWPILSTPPKINIEPENDGLEDDFPFPGVYSQVPCQYSGVYLYSQIILISGKSRLVKYYSIWPDLYIFLYMCIYIYIYGSSDLFAVFWFHFVADSEFPDQQPMFSGVS